jgi:hypothetical protein
MRLWLISGLGAAMFVFAIPGVAGAVTLTESGDAGPLPETAQQAIGAPDLIVGSLSSDDQDVYKICLTGGKTFSAAGQPTGPHDLPDTELFLFDASGRGVYGNDDFGGSRQPQLPAGHPLTPTAGGVYYLAIVSFANRPVGSGAEIFGSPVLQYFPILPPDLGGGDLPVTGWTGSAYYAGGYRVALTGTRACLPTTKEECKNGGWHDFGFEDEGECIAFVNHAHDCSALAGHEHHPCPPRPPAAARE